MRLLVIGGTQFLGPHLVVGALKRGHEVTIFHRGRTDPGIPLGNEVHHVHGDRQQDLGLVSGVAWDAVIDTCGYVPRVVQLSADALADAGRYLFVSSVSVYSDLSLPGPDESSPVARLEDPSIEEVRGDTYGPLKAACEGVVLERFGARATVVRPGLIVGPLDPTDRFTYWPIRISRGGKVLAPGPLDGPVQFIDARDLSEWMLGLLEADEEGIFNATGLPELSFDTFLETTLREVGAPGTHLIWLDPAEIEAQGVQPWSELPAWVPPDPGIQGMQRVVTERAISTGLEFRPLEETVRDTLTWWIGAGPPDRSLRAGLPEEKETAVLSALGKL